jgi:glycosyltransferase involved in cell wall biosynthesis
MNVAIVNPVWDPRARTPNELLDRFPTLTGWAEALHAAGAGNITVLQRFSRVAELERGQVAYRFVVDRYGPNPSLWFDGATLAAAVEAVAPDVAHINGLDHPRLTRRLRRRMPHLGVVVQDHGGFDPAALSHWRRSWMRHGLRAADALVVATDPQVDAFAASGIAPSTLKLRVVMEASTSLHVPTDPAPHAGLAILFVGRLNRNKDPLTVLEGFARFLKYRPDATLAFVYHDAELESAIRTRLATDADLASNVSLIGAVPHEALAEIYARMDVFALGSHREGSGYAALEAMACGVVPVLTDIPSFRGMTADGRIGALWSPGDARSLCAALVTISSSDLCAQRRAAQSHFERHFSWAAIGRRATEIYREFSRT